MELMGSENRPEAKNGHRLKHIKLKMETCQYQTRITDLKCDCLRQILNYLDFPDLLSVSDANVRLKEVACSVFACKYRDQTFAINTDRINIHSASEPFISTRATPLETIGNFLKYFGFSITKLAIFGSNNEFYTQWIEYCVTKYCAEHLVELFFYNHTNGTMMSELRKPFPNIENVTIIQSFLSHNISEFNSWFPKMRSLKLIDNSVANPLCIEQHFSELETLIIWLHGNRKNGFSKSNLCEAIRLNPNIKDLWFQFYSYPANGDENQMDQDLCRMVAVNMRHLDRFVWSPDNELVQNGERIIFKRVKHFVTEAIAMNFCFKQLDELELRRVRIPMNEMIDFICKNKKLTKLKVTLDLLNLKQASSDQIVKIAKHLPKLTELILDWRIFNIDDAIKFLWICKPLMKLQLLNVSERMGHVSHQITQKHIDNNWKILRTDTDFIFKRKV